MIKKIRKYLLFLIYLTSYILFLTEKSYNQTIDIIGGDQTLTINTGTAVGGLTSVININTSLSYSTPHGGGNPIYSITVNTNCIGQSFDLGVMALNPTGSGGIIAEPEVLLKNGYPDTNFITGIRKNTDGSCTLQYTAYATFEQGNSPDLGNDVHAVTFTIVQVK